MYVVLSLSRDKFKKTLLAPLREVHQISLCMYCKKVEGFVRKKRENRNLLLFAPLPLNFLSYLRLLRDLYNVINKIIIQRCQSNKQTADFQLFSDRDHFTNVTKHLNPLSIIDRTPCTLLSLPPEYNSRQCYKHLWVKIITQNTRLPGVYQEEYELKLYLHR